MKYLKISIENEKRDLCEKIENLSEYIESGNENEDKSILMMQLFQMIQYKDMLIKRLEKLKDKRIYNI